MKYKPLAPTVSDAEYPSLKSAVLTKSMNRTPVDIMAYESCSTTADEHMADEDESTVDEEVVPHVWPLPNVAVDDWFRAWVTAVAELFPPVLATPEEEVALLPGADILSTMQWIGIEVRPIEQIMKSY